jgi:hypothetical protein
MSKNRLLRVIALISVITLISVAVVTKPACALISQNVTSWYWTGDTNAATVAVGDVNGDGTNEIVTAGYYNDGLHWDAQLQVWNASNLALEGVTAWFWTSDTQVSSIAIGDVNGDGKNEIVTGGSYFDGTRWVAQLHVWNGSTLAVVGVTTWYWNSDTQVSSVAIGDVNGDAKNEIVTGGAFYDGTRWVALLHVWNGTSLAPIGVVPWYWTSNTYISSVAVANITGSKSLEIVTGGAAFDGTRYGAQLHIWNGSTLAVEKVTAWYWSSDTDISSIAVANITGGSTLDIVTGGTFFDGTRNIALLHVWNSSTLAVERVTAWYQTSNTRIAYVAVGNYSGGSTLDIITCGSFNDNIRNNAQLIDWNGGTLTPNSATSWFLSSDTSANSVAIGNLGGTHIVVAGSYFDGIRSEAQLTIWG